jgi:heat-inducible transcriptional repressor
MVSTLGELNQRRQAILEYIVGDYIRTAAPVASQQLARRPEFSVSPATIRNDMAALEELGYISRPHSSAGAVPADQAYRFYVQRVTRHPRLPKSVEELVQRTIHPDEANIDGWARSAATALSHVVQNVAITTTPRVFRARMKQLQLVQLHDHQALLVLVMQEARLRQHLVLLDNAVTQQDLNELAAGINSTLAGKTIAEIERGRTSKPAPHRDGNTVLAGQVVVEALRLMALEEQAEPERPHLEGLSHMLGQPEFAGGSRARQAVELLEDDHLLSSVLADGPEPGELRVTIGDEHRNQHLRSFSVVLSSYGVPGAVSGIIGTLGPTRMDYARAMSSVRYLARFLSTLLAALDESQR